MQHESPIPAEPGSAIRLIRKALLRTAAGLFLLAMAGCGRGDADRGLVLAVGGVPAELAAWEKTVADFSAATGVRVELLRQPADSDQRRQGLAAALQAGQPHPDVFLMDIAWVAQFAASGWLSPLDSAGGESDSLPREDAFPPAAAEAGIYDGVRLAFPVYVDAGLLYYRKDLLARHGHSSPPATWDEMISMALSIQKKERAADPDFHGYVWQGAQYEGLVCNFLEVAVSAGGGLPMRGSDIVVESDPNVRALALMRRMLAEDGISPPETFTGMKEEEARLHFQKGSALFERNWPYAWALHDQEGSPVRGRTGIAPLPHFPGQASAATLGGWLAGVSRFTRNPAAARKLAGYLVSMPVQKRLALELGWNPGRTEVYSDPEVLAALPHFRELGGIFAHAVARPNLPYWTSLSEILQRHLNAALAGGPEPRAALRAAEAEAKAAAARYGGR